jgi:hypothetical protein
MSDPMDGHLQPVLSDDEIRALDDATHFHESLDWTLRFARAVEQRVLAALAARAGEQQREYDCKWPHCDCDPSGIDSPPCRAEHANERSAPPALPHGAREALRRLWPLIERGTRDFVFTAEKAGEVAADMATLRAALGEGE